nr:hypothetical protein [Nanoarchaeum sp.]
MKNLITSFVCILFLLIVFSITLNVEAATYYVSPTGNDNSGDGSEGNPWRNLSRAIYGAGKVAADSEIIMEDGYYLENATALGAIYTDSTYTIRARNNGAAILQCGNCTTYNLYMGGTAGAGATISGIFINNTLANTDCLGIRGSNVKAFVYNVTTRGCKDSIEFTTTGSTINQGIIDKCDLEGTRDGYTINLQTSGTTNVNITNNNFTKQITFNTPNSGIGYVNNSIYGDIRGRAGIEKYLNITPIVSPTKIDFSNVRLTQTYPIENFTFNQYGDVSENVTVIYFLNSTGFRIRNNSFGQENSYMNIHNTSYILNVININTWSGNITIENNSFYLNNTYAGIDALGVLETGMLDNISVTDNYLVMYNGTYGFNLGYCVKNSKIVNNTGYAMTGDISHFFGLGVESSVPTDQCYRMLTNNNISNNLVYAPTNDIGNIHVIFMGYCDNFSVLNNNVHGGKYNYVLKNNHNGIVNNNLAANGTFFGVLHKGGSNVTYTNLTVYSSMHQSGAYPLSIGIESGNPNYTSVSNVTIYNSTIYSGITTTETIINHNASVNVYNLNVNKSKIVFDSNPLSNLTMYYELAMIMDENTTMDMSNNLNETFSYSDLNYTTSYFKSRFFSPSLNLTYSPFAYNVTTLSATSTGSFELESNYTLDLRIVSGCSENCEVTVTSSSRRRNITCVENWNCSSWSNCSSGIRTRQCSDLNSCGTEVNKSITSRTCGIPVSVEEPVVEEPQEVQKF